MRTRQSYLFENAVRRGTFVLYTGSLVYSKDKKENVKKQGFWSHCQDHYSPIGTKDFTRKLKPLQQPWKEPDPPELF